MKLTHECRLIIRTGERGTDEELSLRVDGEPRALRKLCGGSDSGEVLLASLRLAAAPACLSLGHAGLEAWDVDHVELFQLAHTGVVSYLRAEPEEPLWGGRELDLSATAAPTTEEFEV